MRTIWVDLNTRDDDGFHYTLLEEAKGVAVNEVVLLDDGEGIQTTGVIVRVDERQGLVYIRSTAQARDWQFSGSAGETASPKDSAEETFTPHGAAALVGRRR